MDRRQFIAGGAATLALWHKNSLATAVFNTNPAPKLVWVVLRGALDSLATVIPAFDPNLATLRPTIKPDPATLTQPLSRGFYLHPSLKNLYSWYQAQQLLPIVAVSSGFDNRSHFDGQDFLESGLKRTDHDNGWLARVTAVNNDAAIAVAQSTPLSLRGGDNVNTWYPSKLKQGDDDLYAALQKLYQHDDQLLAKLNDGLKLRATTMSQQPQQKNGRFTALAKGCGKLMSAPDGPDCAMLALGGWDTHNNQTNRLNRQLALLDDGLGALKESLGEQWQNTVVVIATEFGRTAKENGTKGTDHGTASTLLLAGGAVAGGRVLGEWPGLQTRQLFEARDLQPTSHTFSWLSTLMTQHWGMNSAQAAALFDGAPSYSERLVP